MTITKPIIIFGTGRSGTTVFHQMLSEHHHLAWMSRLCDIFPDKLILNRMLMRSLEYPLLEKFIRSNIDARECYQFWDYHSKGFSDPYRDLLASDVSIKQKNSIISIMSELTTENRNRPLIKITGWPRLGFLDEVFDDAKFIHVIRDGRAVANSLINVDFWHGWSGPGKWRWGPLSSTYQKEWNRHNQSFIVLAAIQWKILMDAVEEAKKHIEKSRVLEIKYEDLCADPISLFKKTTKFCEIEWYDHLELKLKKYDLKNTNRKYQHDLSLQQQKALNNVLDDYLRKYDYL